MNNAYLEKTQERREKLSKYLGSEELQNTIFNNEGRKFYGDKGDKISNNSTTMLNNAVSDTKRQDRRFFRRNQGGYYMNGKKGSYC